MAQVTAIGEVENGSHMAGMAVVPGTQEPIGTATDIAFTVLSPRMVDADGAWINSKRLQELNTAGKSAVFLFHHFFRNSLSRNHSMNFR